MYSPEEKKNSRLEFWNRFKSYSSVRRRQKGMPAKWIMNNTGIRQLKLKFEFDEHKAFVGIDIETRNVDRRLELFGRLEMLKTIFHKSMNQELNWELEHLLANGKSISRTGLEIQNVNVYDPECWPKVFTFFYKNMMKIEAFYEEYRDFLKSGV